MKKKSNSQSAPARRSLGEGGFFNLRILIGLFMALAGVFLALGGLGVFSTLAQAQARHHIITNSRDPLVPNGFDCSRIHELGIDRQENFRAGAIMIACGEAQGGKATSPFGTFVQAIKKLFAPLNYGGPDVDLITGTDGPRVTQSETFTAMNPDNPQQIVVAYNDSRGRFDSPINISGASVSTDGGNTFTRITCANNTPPCQIGQSPFSNTVGDPVVLYSRRSSTWYTVWIDEACGGFGLGGYKSTNPSDPNSWTHFCAHNNSNDDRPSGWVDNNPSSPFYGNLYVSWNNFNIGGGALYVTHSTDDGNTWNSGTQLRSSFVRDVQITGDLVTGDLYEASMNEGGGGLSGPRSNLIFKSTDGGNTWSNTYTGPTFLGPGSGLCSDNSYFASMFGSYWRHMGWGEPAAINQVVHYVYAQHGSGSDAGDVYYIRSTDGGVTFSAPLKLNTDTGTASQWQPNLSVSPSGTVFATWYDTRNGGQCSPGVNTPCYQMFGRMSNDNGVTWLPDMPLSDVVSPLPGQPDGGIVACYAGDYYYQKGEATSQRTAWVDGRVLINNASQQDAFTDAEPVGPTAQDALSRMVHGGAGTFDIPLPLTGNVGIECRSGGAMNNYQMIVDFATSVTVESASVTSGTGMVGSFSGSGTSEITVNLTGVTDAQRITMTLHGVNNGTSMGDVPVSMGVLVGDTNGDGLVNSSDVALTKSQVGQAVMGSNFREDVNADGVINSTDVAVVKSDVGTALPP